MQRRLMGEVERGSCVSVASEARGEEERSALLTVLRSTQCALGLEFKVERLALCDGRWDFEAADYVG